MRIQKLIHNLPQQIQPVISFLKQHLPQSKRVRRVWFVFFVIFALFELCIWLIPIPKDRLFRASSTLVFDRNQKLMYAFTSKDDMWRIRTSLTDISPLLQKYLLKYEDQWFYWHPGINPAALFRALRANLAAHRVVYGGSTLTMQIARIMEPKQRTWSNKLIEIFRAFQLEQRYRKRTLLEIYFNIAPYGGNIEGVAAASWLYFGKEPEALSAAEAALLAGLPNSPTQLRPDLVPQKAKGARDKLLKYLQQRGLLSGREYQEALAEESPVTRLPWPTLAPHLCYELKRRYPEVARIYTTVDLQTQVLAEGMLKAHIKKLHSSGITNGAVVVLNNKTHQLMAAVGSADFSSAVDQGQVNGFLAPRSPGSALKPFVYAMGMDRGIITPQHYLEDVPVDFSGYCPENYDRTYNGLVSARDALARSLNIPAINLLASLGDEGLYQLLRKARFSTITAVDQYGLPIVIGGCEVNLLELTALYSTLACEGNYIYPQWAKEQAVGSTINLFSPGAAYLITEILTEVSRPDLPSCWEFTSLPKVAWKTGTSYGHRDAWSIGYNPYYTIGVWVGNFSGEGRTGLVGAEAAAPLLFNLFNKVKQKNKENEWFVPPVEVATREVCSLSGQTPGPYCQNLVRESYLTNASPDQECEFHQAAFVDKATGYRLPPHYASMAGKKEELVYIKWPPRIATWFERNGRFVQQLPQLLPEYQQLVPGQAPVIHSPLANYQYLIRGGIALEFQKICLDAAAANDVQKLYWFVDGKFFGTVTPGGKLFYLPEVGKHQVVCQDDQGRSSKVSLVIKE
ncbi:MAG TPA: penicillin-binding protein 1C [Bacillota bacterium]|nr:penicillin-binding protein 1C [Bacillota bacterium]